MRHLLSVCTTLVIEWQEEDYRRRVAKYEIHYESIGKNVDDAKNAAEERFSYLVCDHSRQHFVVHNVRGYLPQKIVNFISNMRTTTHSFYLTRYVYDAVVVVVDLLLGLSERV